MSEDVNGVEDVDDAGEQSDLGGGDVNEAAVDDWTAETTAFERVHAVVRGLYEPASATAVAERARVSPTTARAHLRTLADTGTVVVEEGSPTTYRRSRTSVVTEHAAALLADHSRAELARQVADCKARMREWRSEYGVESPEAFARSVADADTPTGQVLTEWETTRRNCRLAEAALAIDEAAETRADGTDDTNEAEFGEPISS